MTNEEALARPESFDTLQRANGRLKIFGMSIKAVDDGCLLHFDHEREPELTLDVACKDLAEAGNGGPHCPPLGSRKLYRSRDEVELQSAPIRRGRAGEAWRGDGRAHARLEVNVTIRILSAMLRPWILPRPKGSSRRSIADRILIVIICCGYSR